MDYTAIVKVTNLAARLCREPGSGWRWRWGSGRRMPAH
jgi:hypothetical protein